MESGKSDKKFENEKNSVRRKKDLSPKQGIKVQSWFFLDGFCFYKFECCSYTAFSHVFATNCQKLTFYWWIRP